MPNFRNRTPLHHASVVIAILTLWSIASSAFNVVAQEKPGLPNYDLSKPRSPSLFSGAFDKSDMDAKPTVEIKLAPPDAKPGDEVTLSIAVDIPGGGYTYSTNRDFNGATRIHIAEPKGLEPVDAEFQSDHPPKVIFEPLFKRSVEKFFDKVTWSRKFRLLPDATPADASVKLLLDYQVCNDVRCLTLQESRAVTLAGTTPIDPKSIPIKPSPRTVRPTPAPTAKQEFKFQQRPLILGNPGPAEVVAELEPASAKPGETVTLRVGIKLDPEWHTYSITLPEGQAATATLIKVAASSGLTPVGDAFTASQPPKIKVTDVLRTVYRQEVHEGEIFWTRQYKVTAADYGVAGSIKYQTCTGDKCLLAKTISFSLGQVPAQATPETAKTPIHVAGSDIAPAETAGAADNPASAGLVPFLLTAVLAGFAALLTPCVFPMVPITVSFFLKQSEKQHHKPVTMASVYCAGIVATFTILGIAMAALFSASKLNVLANDPWLNVGIAGVLVFFGLNLLGLFELRVPSALMTWSAGKEGRGGMIGVLFMALTFTLVSFTCTFAFVGGLLVLAARGQYYWPIIGMLAFSSAFALPFFFLAIFPSFLQKLPKSGGWMNRVKVVTGLIECGAALKFLSVADLSWNPVPYFFDYAFVMSAWAVIALAIGTYLLGMFRLSHDTPSDTVSVPRFITALSFIGFAAYLAVGLFGAEKPTGRLWETIAAFAPPKFSGAETELGPVLQHDGLEYALDFERALEMARSTQQPVFFDFTGVNCINCRKMEIVMAQPHLRDRLQKFVRAQLYADNVPTIADTDVAEAILAKNRDLQETWFGDVTLPAYAIVTPDRELLVSYKGYQPNGFAEFLDRGLSEWQKRSGHAAAQRSGRPITASR